MKKYTYILFAVLIVGLSIQPISNSYKALKADKDKSSRENYLKTLTEDLKFEGSYKEMRKNTPKSQRPDLRGLREYKMTYDSLQELFQKRDYYQQWKQPDLKEIL